MIADLLVVLTAAALGGALGVILHEFAHYLVLRLSGRRVGIDIIRRGLVVIPRVKFTVPDGEVPRDIRLAAGAPVVLGLVIGPFAVMVAIAVSIPALALVLCGCFWCVKLSKQDRRLLRGVES